MENQNEDFEMVCDPENDLEDLLELVLLAETKEELVRKIQS